MKKFILLTAMLLLSVLLLAACGGDPGNTPADGTTTADNDSDANVTTTEPPVAEDSTEPPVTEDPTAPRVIFDGTTCEYTIIRSEYCNDMVKEASIDLRNAMKEYISEEATKAVSLKTDFDKNAGRDGTIENDNKEILIGSTNRKESKDVLATLGDKEYVIKWVGNKLLILGADDYATAQAVAEFIKQYLGSAQESLTVAADVNITGTASIQKFMLEDGADLRIMSFNIAGTSKEYDDRKSNMIQVILDYLPDVAGFQEANATTHSDILKNDIIAEYYSINKAYHTGGSPANYTPILYLKSKYKQIESGVEWNNSRYTGTNTKSNSWTVLERISDGKRFIVLNIHGSLWSEDYKLPAGETHASMKEKAAVQWKVDNVKQLLAKIDELRAKYGDIAVFTTGDYNFNNTHSAHQVMLGAGMSSAQQTATVSATTSNASYHGTVGSMPAANGLAIDHIFYDPDNATALTYGIGLRKVDLDASDHCPVYADIKLK
ncbi:MAG: endonuclease/exonuclease/phosphatase family protein [Clostridia bacterium]|nr:endonuclease/exonuclease/phosphatase family protein [Clostridia bacterium]